MTAHADEVRLHTGLRQALDSGEPVTLGAILRRVSGPTHAVALVMLALPFLQPVPTLGLAYPVGLAIAALGVAIALGRRPELPAFVVRQGLRRELVHGMAMVAQRVHRAVPARRRLEMLVRPALRSVAGLSLALAGILLFLPIPLPFSNFFPAVAILLLALGLLEHDGLLVAAGHGVTLACVVVLYGTWSQVVRLLL